MQDFTVDQVELGQRLAMSRARIEAAALARKKQKQADRKAGRIPEGVSKGLRSCTVDQLRKAKKLGNAVYRDLVQALVMVDMDHLVLAVPNSYKYQSSGKPKISSDYENTVAVAKAVRHFCNRDIARHAGKCARRKRSRSGSNES